MNLNGIVRSAIGAVNPNVFAYLARSAGSSTADDGSRIAVYARPVKLVMQVQELTANDFRQIEGMNIQAQTKKFYMNGLAQGAVRLAQLGGDIIILDGQIWLTVKVMEAWPDWSSVIACQQLA